MKIWIPIFLANAVIRYAMKRPYTHLGDYMRRYWVVRPAGHGEHSDERDMAKNQWGARIHWILKSDDDRAMHDHPFDSISVILKGGYWEHKPDGSRKWCGPGTIIRRKAEDVHRLELVSELSEHGQIYYQPCWSLFIMGPWRRDWGFHTGYGWVYWRDYCDGGLLDDSVRRETNPFLNYAGRYGAPALYLKMRKVFPDEPGYKYLCNMSPYHRQILAKLLEIEFQVDDMTRAIKSER